VYLAVEEAEVIEFNYKYYMCRTQVLNNFYRIFESAIKIGILVVRSASCP